MQNSPSKRGECADYCSCVINPPIYGTLSRGANSRNPWAGDLGSLIRQATGRKQAGVDMRRWPWTVHATGREKSVSWSLSQQGQASIEDRPPGTHLRNAMAVDDMWQENTRNAITGHSRGVLGGWQDRQDTEPGCLDCLPGRQRYGGCQENDHWLRAR